MTDRMDRAEESAVKFYKDSTSFYSNIEYKLDDLIATQDLILAKIPILPVGPTNSEIIDRLDHLITLGEHSNTNTDNINSKLIDVVNQLSSTVSSLSNQLQVLNDSYTKLTAISADASGISAKMNTVLTDLTSIDHSLGSVANSTSSIDSKETTIISNLSSISSNTSDLTGIGTLVNIGNSSLTSLNHISGVQDSILAKVNPISSQIGDNYTLLSDLKKISLGVFGYDYGVLTNPDQEINLSSGDTSVLNMCRTFTSNALIPFARRYGLSDLMGIANGTTGVLRTYIVSV